MPVFRNLDLKRFDCILLASRGLTELTPADIKKVRAYAEGGGRVLVSANSFFRGTVMQANTILDGYGLLIRDEEARGAGANDVTVRKNDFDPAVVKAGVTSVHFFRASPVAVTDAKKGRVWVKAAQVGNVGDGFVAVATAGKGRVIALGESLWWHWIHETQAGPADNAKLLRWLLLPPAGP
jgi:hypothetical protein